MAGLGNLGKLDPLGRGVPKFGEAGPGALEVAMKRNDAEDAFAKGLYAQQAEQEAAKKLADDKKQEAEATTLADLTKDTVWLPHSLKYTDKVNSYIDDYRDILLAGGDPNDIKSEAGLALFLKKRAMKQYVANSDQLMKLDEKVTADIRGKDADFFEPGTYEAWQQSVSDPDLLDQGKLPTPPTHLFNTEKYLDSIFGSIKASQTSTASADGTFSRDTEFTLPQDIKEVSQVAATNPYAKPNLERMYTEMTPNEQEFINALAKKNNMSRAGAMAYHYGTAKYLYQKETERSEQVSSSGAGAQAAKRGSLWFGKLLEDYMNKSYQTKQVPNQVNLFSGEVDNINQDPTTLVGLTWDEKIVPDRTGNQVKTTRVIKDLNIDYDKQRFIIDIGPAGNDKNSDQTEMIPFDQAESKMGPRILGYNKLNIAAQGVYDWLPKPPAREPVRRQERATS